MTARMSAFSRGGSEVRSRCGLSAEPVTWISIRYSDVVYTAVTSNVGCGGEAPVNVIVP